MHPKHIIYFCAFLFFAPIWQLDKLHAADWFCTPSLRIQGEYNSNIFLVSDSSTSNNKFEDFSVITKPKIEISGLADQTRFHLDSNARIETYTENEDFNTINHDSGLSLAGQWTPKLSTDVSARFTKDMIFESELEEGLSEKRKKRYRYDLDFSANFYLFEEVALTVTGRSGGNNYPEGPYPDLQRWVAGFGPSWKITPKDMIQLKIDYSITEYENTENSETEKSETENNELKKPVIFVNPDMEIQTLSPSLSWRRDLYEEAYLTMSAGYSQTWTKISQIDQEDGLKTEEEHDDYGLVFDLSLNADWTKRFSTILSAGRDQYDAVGARRVERIYAKTTMKYNLSETISLNIRLRYHFSDEKYKNKYSLYSDRNSDYLRITPYLYWRVSDNVSINLWTDYGKIRMKWKYNVGREPTTNDGLGPTSSSGKRYRAWLGFSYRWPRLLANN